MVGTTHHECLVIVASLEISTTKMRVFKYRGGKKKIFKRDLFALERNFFWGAEIDGLNDPCEALILSDKFDQQSKYLKYFLGTTAQNNLTKVKEAILSLMEVNNRIGIFSLSQTYKDKLLWAHYAYSHHGFCIEYDLEILKDGYRNKIYSFPIKYDNKPPDIDFSDVNSNNQNLIHKMIGYKSKRWEYEEEYRIITNLAGEFFYPPNAVKAIYFGIIMPEKNKLDLIDRLKSRGIKFYQIIQKHKTYKFVALKNNLRIVKILLVAPEFSDDFVTDCEMDTEMNLSLITASTLSNIFEAFKESKYQEFPHVLFRDIVINEERILKALSK